MSFDLALKPTCSGCGSTTDLYGSNCKHMTLCLTCGKKMAESGGRCFDCGATVTRLIREYNVRASSSNDKNYFIGRFATGLPNFSRKRSAENKWTLVKEGIQGRQMSDALRERYKNKPWMLEDEISQFQYHGQLEGGQSASYYLLMLQGKEFVAIPAGSWYNFNKVAHYKQLTLEEAEEKMKNRRKTADGYERWMMKAANNGAALFAEAEKLAEKVTGNGGGGRGRKKSADDEDGDASDKGDEDEATDSERKARILGKKTADDEEEDEAPKGDFDDDDDIEKGDDWEHEEIFTDDDEAVGNDAEEREDLAPEIPAPPEIKEDDEEDEKNEEEGGLSSSGKEIKKLLGRDKGMNDSDAEDDDDSDDQDEEDRPSPVLAPKVPKEEPTDNSPLKSASTKGTPPTSKSSKGKRKLNGEDTKTPSTAAHAKKVKTENEQKPTVKEEPGTKSGGTSKPAPSTPSKGGPAKGGSAKGGSTSSSPVTEEELRAVLTMQRSPMTTQDLVAHFKSRLKCKEDKDAFAEILKRIGKVQKMADGQRYVVLRDK